MNELADYIVNIARTDANRLMAEGRLERLERERNELLEIAKRVLMTEEPRLPKGQSNYAPSFLDELRAVISKAEAA
jgi:hypothetical protein